MRTALDLTPLYRSVIGSDRMADLIENAMRTEADSGYPPYDIEKTGEDAYRISLAVAGFSGEELNIIAQPNLLIVNGAKAQAGERSYLHRGIAARNFEQRFELADYVTVQGADLADGLLTIELVREIPEALKPRRIEIAGAEPRRIEQDPARRAA